MTRVLFLCVLSGCIGSFTETSAKELEWKASTDNWPESLWVYKVVSQEFSEPVISNLLAIASLSPKDRAKPPRDVSALDKGASYFTAHDGSRHLAICQAKGWVEYKDERAEARMTEPAEDVPAEKELLPLALKYLRLVGIDRSQLAIKSESCEMDLFQQRGTRGRRDKTTGELIDEVSSRGLFFTRRIDGVPLDRFGSVEFNFGNHGKIIDLRIHWRNLKPYELHGCLSPTQIINWLETGKAKFPSMAGPPELLSKLTIIKATPVYEARDVEEDQQFVLPYLLLDIVGETKDTKPVFKLKCPILEDAVGKAKK